MRYYKIPFNNGIVDLDYQNDNYVNMIDMADGTAWVSFIDEEFKQRESWEELTEEEWQLNLEKMEEERKEINEERKKLQVEENQDEMLVLLESNAMLYEQIQELKELNEKNALDSAENTALLYEAILVNKGE